VLLFPGRISSAYFSLEHAGKLRIIILIRRKGGKNPYNARTHTPVEKRRCYGSPILLLPFPQQMGCEEDVEDHPYPFLVAHKINIEETECRWNLFSLLMYRFLYIAMR